MKRILLSLIAFAGVFANAFALDDVPAWQNDWTSAPAVGDNFYLYNKTSGAGFIKGNMSKASRFASDEEAAIWTRNRNSYSTKVGNTTYYLSMSTSDAWTNNTRAGYGDALFMTFAYVNSDNAFYIEGSAVFWQSGLLNNGGVFDANFSKVAGVGVTYNEWYLINTTQYNNHMAYKKYHVAASEAISKDASDESKAWRNQFLNLDYKLTDLSTVDHSAEIDALTTEIKAWNEHPEHYALFEEENKYSSSDFCSALTHVAVKRNLNVGHWNTFCLPFAWDKSIFGDDVVVEIKEFNGLTIKGDSYSLKFVDADNIEAATPYLVRVNKQVDSYFKVDNAVMSTKEPKTTISKDGAVYSFIGTYSHIDKLDLGTFFISNDQFWLVIEGEGVVLDGFRGYFRVPGAAANALAVSFEDEDVTDITSVDDNDDDNDNYYNVAGQRVNANAKGIIIKNGKKYFVR